MNPVEWLDIALDQLADIYVRAEGGEKLDVIAATMDVNARLGDRPAARGESRDGDRRVTFFGRLTVYYRSPAAADPGGLVTVVYVRWRQVRPRP